MNSIKSTLNQEIDLKSAIRNKADAGVSFIRKYNNTIFYLCLFLAASGYFAVNYADALSKGGRWDLYQHIAMADRFLDGKGFYYSPIEASTPYFPGVGLLSVVIGHLFGDSRDIILLFIASILGSVFYVLLVKIAVQLSENKWLSFIVVSCAVFNHFGFYKFYMNEFKADTLVYIYAVILVMMILSFQNNRERKIGFYLGLFGVSFLMDITKQQALYVDVALGVYIVFSRKLRMKEKTKLLVPMVSAGIVDVVILFSITDMKLLAIENLSKMPYWDGDHIYEELIRGVYEEHKMIFWLAVISCILFCVTKKKSKDLFHMWFLITMAVLIAQIAGGMKIGGNGGNYEAGLILVVPFVPICLDRVIRYFIKDKRAGILYAIMIAYLIYPRMSDMNIYGYQRVCDNMKKVKPEQEIQYLANYYSGKKCMYDSDHYMLIYRSGLMPGADIYTTPLYCEEYFDLIKTKIEDHEYDVIVINVNDLETFDEQTLKYFDHESNTAEALLDNYVLDDRGDIPPGLKGKVYILP